MTHPWLPHIQSEVFRVIRQPFAGCDSWPRCAKTGAFPNSRSVYAARLVLDALVSQNVQPVGIRALPEGGLLFYWIRDTTSEDYADIACDNDGFIFAQTKRGDVERYLLPGVTRDGLEEAARVMARFMVGVKQIR